MSMDWPTPEDLRPIGSYSDYFAFKEDIWLDKEKRIVGPRSRENSDEDQPTKQWEWRGFTFEDFLEKMMNDRTNFFEINLPIDSSPPYEKTQAAVTVVGTREQTGDLVSKWRTKGRLLLQTAVNAGDCAILKDKDDVFRFLAQMGKVAKELGFSEIFGAHKTGNDDDDVILYQFRAFEQIGDCFRSAFLLQLETFKDIGIKMLDMRKKLQSLIV